MNGNMIMVTLIFLATERHIPDSYRAVRIPEYSLRNPKIDSSEIHTFWNQESMNVSYDVVLKGP